VLLEQVEYVRPDSVDEALALLADEDSAAPLAGGQSLVNILKNRVAAVELLVDISALTELRRISAAPDGSLEIGACVTYDELDNSGEVRAAHRALADAAGHIEDQQIRNRGTIGGNCCLSDPTNNLPPLLVALDATMHLRSRSGRREVAALDFFKGYFATALEPGELLVSIGLPAPPPLSGTGYVSLAVAADAKAIVRCAATVRLENGRGATTIGGSRVVLARVAHVPIRHLQMESRLNGREASEEAVRAAAEAVGEGLEPITDMHGSSEYRRRMARVVACRAVLEAVADARQGGAPAPAPGSPR